MITFRDQISGRLGQIVSQHGVPVCHDLLADTKGQLFRQNAVQFINNLAPIVQLVIEVEVLQDFQGVEGGPVFGDNAEETLTVLRDGGIPKVINIGVENRPALKLVWVCMSSSGTSWIWVRSRSI